MFANKSFYIQRVEFPEYVEKLRADIESAGGSLANHQDTADYILHYPPSSHFDWHKEHIKARRESRTRAVLRPCHWFYACIHTGRIVKPGRDDVPLFSDLVRVDGQTGKESRRPLSVYLTINMPQHPEQPGDDPAYDRQAVVDAVARDLESNGGFRSMKRNPAHVLVLCLKTQQCQRYLKEARSDQMCVEREWFDQIIKDRIPYCRRSGQEGGPPKPPQNNITEPAPDDRNRNRASTVRPARPRVDYTQTDDENILRWLTYHDPSAQSWKSRRLYTELVDPSHPSHLPFANRHSAQSWHGRVRTHYEMFIARSAALRGAGLDRLGRTREERARAAAVPSARIEMQSSPVNPTRQTTVARQPTLPPQPIPSALAIARVQPQPQQPEETTRVLHWVNHVADTCSPPLSPANGHLPANAHTRPVAAAQPVDGELDTLSQLLTKDYWDNDSDTQLTVRAEPPANGIEIATVNENNEDVNMEFVQDIANETVRVVRQAVQRAVEQQGIAIEDTAADEQRMGPTTSEQWIDAVLTPPAPRVATTTTTPAITTTTLAVTPTNRSVRSKVSSRHTPAPSPDRARTLIKRLMKEYQLDHPGPVLRAFKSVKRQRQRERGGSDAHDDERTMGINVALVRRILEQQRST